MGGSTKTQFGALVKRVRYARAKKDYDKARSLAIRLHKNQKRKHGDEKGKPYINHIKRVVKGVKGVQAKTVAWLHDAAEDGHISLGSIRKRFPKKIANAVNAITKRKSETYFTYIDRVKTNPLARSVKRSDLRDNMRGNPPSSLRDRYNKALDILK